MTMNDQSGYFRFQVSPELLLRGLQGLQGLRGLQVRPQRDGEVEQRGASGGQADAERGKRDEPRIVRRQHLVEAQPTIHHVAGLGGVHHDRDFSRIAG